MISHSSQNIRYHSPSDTYIISKKSFFDQDVIINGNVMVGPNVSFWKNVKIQGDAKFGKGCIIEGRLDAQNVLIGSQSVVNGPIHANGNVSLFQNVAVRSIESSGGVSIMEGCTADYINGKKLEIIGKAQVKKIGAIAKMAVKANNMSTNSDRERKKIGFSELEMLPDLDFENELNTEISSDIQEASLQQANDPLTPQFPMENEDEDAELLMDGYPKPKQSETACVPEDEMMNVELIVCESNDRDTTVGMKTIETPLGSFFVSIDSNTSLMSEPASDSDSVSVFVSDSVPNSVSDSASDTISDSALDSVSDTALDSVSDTAAVPKRKPYPDFKPMVVPAEERKKHPSQNKQVRAPSQPEESKNLPDAESDSSSSKLMFEILPSKTKTDKEEVRSAVKPAKKTEKDIEAERENSKLWYEDRVRPMQKFPKKYPPYL